ncbi:MAG: Tll0287-like domain-containing protein [Planctomycetota bacterium]|jgi:hypothetical protein
MRYLALGSLLFLAACGKSELTPREARARAERATQALTAALLKRLNAALSEGPPEHAIDVCGGVAQEISADVRKEQGVEVRRTSLKIRNPENRPDEYEAAWLERAKGGEKIPGEGVSEVLDLPGGGKELRYVRPIGVAVYCTKCHGPQSELTAKVKAILKERYPDDQATGYRVGDLRGIYSVRVPLR